MSNEAKMLFGLRSIKEHIILLDWNSSVDAAPTAHVQILKNILQDVRRAASLTVVFSPYILNLFYTFQWDPDVVYRNPILILNGGYEMFSLTYPMLAPRPPYRPTTVHEDGGVGGGEVLETIEYPHISDIKMKDESSINGAYDESMEDLSYSAFGPPKIDRSNKPATEEIYKISQRKMENARESLEAEVKWKRVVDNESKIHDHVSREEYELTKQKLQNEIIERDDTNLDLVSLRWVGSILNTS